MSKTTVIFNKFNGVCCQCGLRVDALAGIAFKSGSDPWAVAHHDCKPALSAPLLKQQEAQRQAYLEREAERQVKEAAKEAEKALRKAQQQARREGLLLKTGLDLASRVNVEHHQHAYNDSYVDVLTFSGEGTIEEFNELLATPAQSSWGKLRWSEGESVSRIEGNKVFVSGSVGICD